MIFLFSSWGQMAHMCSKANFKAWWLILPMESPRRRVSGHPVRCCLDYLTWYGKSHLSCGWDRIWAGHMRQTSWAPACMTLQLPWLRVQCDQRSRPWCPGLSPWCTIFWTMSLNTPVSPELFLVVVFYQNKSKRSKGRRVNIFLQIVNSIKFM